MDCRDDRRGPLDSLPCQLYLLACDVEAAKLTKRDVIGHVLRAAVLVELTERGCLTDEDGTARPVGDRRTGDPVLDDALRRIAARKRPARWKSLVATDRRRTVRSVEAALVDAGHITAQPRPWRAPRVVVHELVRVMELRGTVAETLKGGCPVRQVTLRHAALVALTAAGELPAVLTGKERREHKERIKALTERAGEAAPALKKALDEMQLVAAALVGSAAVSGGGGGS